MKSPLTNWRDKEKYKFLGKTGVIISLTKINNPPKGFGRLAYYAAIVGFKNKEKKTAALVLEGKKARIGAQVKAVIRRIGEPGPEDIIHYGIKFKVV